MRKHDAYKVWIINLILIWNNTTDVHSVEKSGYKACRHELVNAAGCHRLRECCLGKIQHWERHCCLYKKVVRQEI